MMGSSKYEYDQNGLELDVFTREETFKMIYKDIYEKVMTSTAINQKVLALNGIDGTQESFLNRVLRQLTLDIRVGRFLATDEEFLDLYKDYSKQ